MFCPPKNTSRVPSQKKTELIQLVQNNNIKSIFKLVSETPDLICEQYEEYNNRTILQIACDDDHGMAKVTGVTIDLLIILGAKLTDLTPNEKWQPLHLAAVNTNENKLLALVKYLNYEGLQSLVFCSISNKQNCNFKDEVEPTYCNNALHLILKYGRVTDCYNNCCKILIDEGINIYEKDSNGVTPFDLIQASEDQSLIQYLQSPNHIFVATKCRRIFDLLKTNSDEFLKEIDTDNVDLNICDGVSEESSSCTLLQLACFKKRADCVEKILQNRSINPNMTITKNTMHPLVIALNQDCEDVVKLFLNHKYLKMPDDILIHLQQKYQDSRISAKNMDLILDYVGTREELEVLTFLTKTDDLNRTALHYATAHGYSDNVLKLLSLGSSLYVKDSFGFIPLNHIEPIVFEQYLESCIKMPKSEEDINNMVNSLRNGKKNFNVEIDYHALINKNHKEEIFESKFLECFAEDRDFRYLLNHPVVLSYLTLKWRKFRVFIYINLILYFIAYISLLFHGFGFNTYKGVANALLTISLILLILREMFHIIIHKTKYFKSLEGLLNLFLVGGIIYIIAAGSFEVLLNQNLLVALAVVLLTSTLGIFIQFGHVPIFTTKVLIFRRISKSFLLYMLFYIFPVMAFFFCFFMLLEASQKNSNKFWRILYQTTVMFAGDPDSNFPSDSLQTNPIFSHMIYLLFLVVIGIILQNLLIGLAVSDLQEIKSEAKLMDKRQRAKYITSIERVLLEQYQKYNIPFLKKIFKYLLDSARVFDSNSTILIVQPYNKGRVYAQGNNQEFMLIQDENVLARFRKIFKHLDSKLKKKEKVSMEKLYERVEKIEILLDSISKKL